MFASSLAKTGLRKEGHGQDPKGQLKDLDFFPIRSRTSLKALKKKKASLIEI